MIDRILAPACGVAMLVCASGPAARADDGFLLEAENFTGVEELESSNPDDPAVWSRFPADRTAALFSGGKAVRGKSGASAKVTTDFPEAGRYRIWALTASSRSYQDPGFRILVRQGGNEQTLEFDPSTKILLSEEAQESGHSTRAWIAGEVACAKGPAEIVLFRPDTPERGSPRLATVDTLYVTKDGEFRPGFEDATKGGVLNFPSR